MLLFNSPTISVQELFLRLDEAKVQVVSVTPSWIYVYKKMKSGAVKRIKFAHKSLHKHADLIVDPPPGGDKAVGWTDTAKHLGADSVQPLKPGMVVPIGVDPGKDPAKVAKWAKQKIVQAEKAIRKLEGLPPTAEVTKSILMQQEKKIQKQLDKKSVAESEIQKHTGKIPPLSLKAKSARKMVKKAVADEDWFAVGFRMLSAGGLTGLEWNKAKKASRVLWAAASAPGASLAKIGNMHDMADVMRRYYWIDGDSVRKNTWLKRQAALATRYKLKKLAPSKSEGPYMKQGAFDAAISATPIDWTAIRQMAKKLSPGQFKSIEAIYDNADHFDDHITARDAAKTMEVTLGLQDPQPPSVAMWMNRAIDHASKIHKKVDKKPATWWGAAHAHKDWRKIQKEAKSGLTGNQREILIADYEDLADKSFPTAEDWKDIAGITLALHFAHVAVGQFAKAQSWKDAHDDAAKYAKEAAAEDDWWDEAWSARDWATIRNNAEKLTDDQRATLASAYQDEIALNDPEWWVASQLALSISLSYTMKMPGAWKAAKDMWFGKHEDALKKKDAQDETTLGTAIGAGAFLTVVDLMKKPSPKNGPKFDKAQLKKVLARFQAAVEVVEDALDYNKPQAFKKAASIAQALKLHFWMTPSKKVFWGNLQKSLSDQILPPNWEAGVKAEVEDAKKKLDWVGLAFSQLGFGGQWHVVEYAMKKLPSGKSQYKDKTKWTQLTPEQLLKTQKALTHAVENAISSQDTASDFTNDVEKDFEFAAQIAGVLKTHYWADKKKYAYFLNLITKLEDAADQTHHFFSSDAYTVGKEGPSFDIKAELKKSPPDWIGIVDNYKTVLIAPIEAYYNKVAKTDDALAGDAAEALYTIFSKLNVPAEHWFNKMMLHSKSIYGVDHAKDWLNGTATEEQLSNLNQAGLDYLENLFKMKQKSGDLSVMSDVASLLVLVYEAKGDDENRAKWWAIKVDVEAQEMSAAKSNVIQTAIDGKDWDTFTANWKIVSSGHEQQITSLFSAAVDSEDWHKAKAIATAMQTYHLAKALGGSTTGANSGLAELWGSKAQEMSLKMAPPVSDGVFHVSSSHISKGGTVDDPTIVYTSTTDVFKTARSINMGFEQGKLFDMAAIHKAVELNEPFMATNSVEGSVSILVVDGFLVTAGLGKYLWAAPPIPGTWASAALSQKAAAQTGTAPVQVGGKKGAIEVTGEYLKSGTTKFKYGSDEFKLAAAIHNDFPNLIKAGKPLTYGQISDHSFAMPSDVIGTLLSYGFMKKAEVGSLGDTGYVWIAPLIPGTDAALIAVATSDSGQVMTGKDGITWKAGSDPFIVADALKPFTHPLDATEVLPHLNIPPTDDTWKLGGHARVINALEALVAGGFVTKSFSYEITKYQWNEPTTKAGLKPQVGGTKGVQEVTSAYLKHTPTGTKFGSHTDEYMVAKALHQYDPLTVVYGKPIAIWGDHPSLEAAVEAVFSGASIQLKSAVNSLIEFGFMVPGPEAPLDVVWVAPLIPNTLPAAHVDNKWPTGPAVQGGAVPQPPPGQNKTDGEMMAWLKAAGFDDPATQKALLNSQPFIDYLKDNWGEDWHVKHEKMLAKEKEADGDADKISAKGFVFKKDMVQFPDGAKYALKKFEMIKGVYALAMTAMAFQPPVSKNVTDLLGVPFTLKYQAEIEPIASVQAAGGGTSFKFVWKGPVIPFWQDELDAAQKKAKAKAAEAQVVDIGNQLGIDLGPNAPVGDADKFSGKGFKFEPKSVTFPNGHIYPSNTYGFKLVKGVYAMAKAGIPFKFPATSALKSMMGIPAEAAVVGNLNAMHQSGLISQDVMVHTVDKYLFTWKGPSIPFWQAAVTGASVAGMAQGGVTTPTIEPEPEEVTHGSGYYKVTLKHDEMKIGSSYQPEQVFKMALYFSKYMIHSPKKWTFYKLGKKFDIPSNLAKIYVAKLRNAKLISKTKISAKTWELQWIGPKFPKKGAGGGTSSHVAAPAQASAQELKPTEPFVPSKPVKGAFMKSLPEEKGTLAPQGQMTLDSLTLKGSGGHLGGAGEKHLYTDSVGQEWMSKVAAHKTTKKSEPFRAHAQDLFARTALKVKGFHVPISVISLPSKGKGMLGTIQKMLPLGSPPDLGSTSPAKLSEQEKEDVAAEHLLDWMMSQHDSHSKNLMRNSEGRIVGIDKEQCFKYFKDDRLDTNYHPNAKYGENEPYYNTFWRAFAKGEMDFDPKVMEKALSAIESIDNNDYMRSLNGYAESAKLDDDEKRAVYIKARNRKVTLRRDFEKFITEQYKQRTSEAGKFTFKDGWVEVGKKHYKTITETSTHVASEYGANVKPHKTDSSIVAVRMAKESADAEEKLVKMLKEMGIEQVSPMKTGGYYFLAFVKKDAWEGYSKTKKVLIQKDIDTAHSGEATYFPTVDPPALAKPNAEVMSTIEEEELGPEGKRVTADGGALESQQLNAKKWVENGETFYRFQFKLRKKTWESFSQGGVGANLPLKKGKYNKKKDAYVASNDSSGYSANARKWSIGKSEIYLANNSSEWSFMGMVIADIRPEEGEDPKKVLIKLLDKMQSGLAEELMKQPSPEELEVAKLSRVLWAYRPKVEAGLPESQRTVSGLMAKLKGSVTKGDIERVESVEHVDGHTTHVLPGRWKDMANGNLRCFIWGISNPDNAVKILSGAGLMSVNQRLLTGLGYFGSSAGSDIGNGCADNITTRVVTQSAEGKSLQSGNVTGSYQLVIAPDVADRLDMVVYNHDAYGNMKGSAFTSRSSAPSSIKSLQNYHKNNAEAVFRNGISVKKVVRIATQSETNRNTLLKKLRTAKIEEVNNVPIEDFVIIASTYGDVYTKYVKPLGY